MWILTREHPERPPWISRRDFMTAATAFFVWSKTEMVLAQVPWKLNGKKTPELVGFLDDVEEKFRKYIPEWTNNPHERWFAILPDRQDVTTSDVKIYRWTSKNKRVEIYAPDGKRVFPEAKSIAGSGAWERILLNDKWYILVAIGTPIPSWSLIESERSKFTNTYTISTPPNKAFQTPEIQMRWIQYLKRRIREVFQKDIKNEDITSDFSDIALEKELDQRLPLLFAIVEHMDIATMEQANNEAKLREEYERVLTNYALNKNLAYRYGKSAAGARWIMQITPGTFRLFSNKYEDVDLWENHTECTTSTSKSVKLAALLLDENIGTIIRTKWSGITKEGYRKWRDTKSNDIKLPLMLWVLYNAGTAYLKDIWETWKKWNKIPWETQIYLKKIEFVWQKLFWGSQNIKEVPEEKIVSRSKKVQNKKKEITEEEIRSTLRWWRKRLRFEKESARRVAIRARTFDDVKKQIRDWKLVKIRGSTYLKIDNKVWLEWQATTEEKELLHYLTPVAKWNLERLAELFYEKFGKLLQVNSMNRTEEYVKKLRRVNPNATSPSSHEYGTSVDISHMDMSPAEKAFMEKTLLEWQKKWYIIAIKENRSACYHIFSENRVP